ncbi:hypothetical protein MLD38_020675 [Melastoma candidum]|uniref:Uncharacterized protein n=1 Tax=Melastoma candidum TaxID=119954 RepID=A0ACB9QDX8_9MYRT|nr:hypothetical protein MLD38_020675 [Melastoma candidum]
MDMEKISALAALLYLARLVQLSASAYQACENSTDCQALLKFKDGITHDPDDHLRSWNMGNPFCNWSGVTCRTNTGNRVEAVDLGAKGLEGSISPFLFNLSFLTRLSLQGNGFSGAISDGIGRLSELKFMNLSGNKLGGVIPKAIRFCRKLETIDMTMNNLVGVIPDELGLMESLSYLALSVNNLTGHIPSSLSNLTRLTQLELATNYLTGNIPSELGELKNLEIMYLHLNYLEGSIPPSISNCTSLREISLEANRLTGEVPPELGLGLQNLEKMYLLMNSLNGEIPITLANLSKLTLLDLSMNRMEGRVPLELSRLKNLKILYLHSNDFVSGSNESTFDLLTALTNCTYLRKLHLGSCLFSGNLPASVGDLSADLYYFNLLDNHLTGDIPAGIGNLSGLMTLNLGYNRFSGTLPVTLGNLQKLQRLYMGNNNLRGKIPSEIGNMANLGLLDLGQNFLGGPIPSALGSLSQLRYLHLCRNNLSRYIPTEITSSSHLLFLDLSFNNLQGPIPSELGRLTELALSLNLSNNNLEGKIPGSIGNLITLEAIDLSMNKISGKIPSLLGNCISLVLLNLSHNRIEGSIPDSLEKIRNLELLDLAYNSISGSIPAWIVNYPSLKSLNFSFNNLSGAVPDLGKLNNINGSSLLGNLGLCGGPASMKLTPCHDKKKSRRRRIKWLFYAFPLALLCIIVILSVVCCIRRLFTKRETIEREEQPEEIACLTYTQKELEIATDGFRDSNLIGKGSFGSVYKALLGDDDRKTVVAVKVLDNKTLESQRTFRRECQILSSVKHRNLVRMIGSTWTPDCKALILEYIGNGNLEQHLYPNGTLEGGCKLRLDEKASILLDIANGLAYLHEQCPVQVIHCDLKPQNVLLDEDLVAHVADFGVGKLILGDKKKGDLTTTNFLRGTIGYIPPEYGQGIVSIKGDVYSYGVMLLEMLTGRKPTSEFFSEDLDLRKWVASALPDNVGDIIDMTPEEEADLSSHAKFSRFKKCCIDLLEIGIVCTEENPQNRRAMSDVVRRLEQVIKEMKQD